MEIAVIAIIALIVLGPNKLPEAAKSLGKGFREMRDSFQGAAGNDELSFHHDDDEDEDVVHDEDSDFDLSDAVNEQDDKAERSEPDSEPGSAEPAPVGVSSEPDASTEPETAMKPEASSDPAGTPAPGSASSSAT